jgi:hypothetical protein
MTSDFQDREVNKKSDQEGCLAEGVGTKQDLYEVAIVTCLDILGFRELVKTTDATVVNSKLEALERFTFPTPIEPPCDPEEIYEPIVLQFSDSVLRIRRTQTKWNRQYSVGLLFQELIDLVHAQGELIQKSVLIRGGVSYGPIYLLGTRVFGPAFISAYELESRFALYPRIVVDPILLAEFHKDPLLRSAQNTPKGEEEYISRLIRRGDDGIWFVDYIRAIEHELDEPEMYPIFLQMHRKLIIEGGKRFTELDSPLSKYLWLAVYHNERISELTAKWYKYYGIKKNKLLISESDIPALQKVRTGASAKQRTRCR